MDYEIEARMLMRMTKDDFHATLKSRAYTTVDRMFLRKAFRKLRAA